MCPYCGHTKTKVYGTRTGLTTERFRECTKCGYRFLTKELVKADPLPLEYNNYLEEIGEICKKLKTENGKLKTENGVESDS